MKQLPLCVAIVCATAVMITAIICKAAPTTAVIVMIIFGLIVARLLDQ